MSYKEIWDTLSKVDVSAHIEKKMNLSYLSWAWAWGVLMEYYPDAQYEVSSSLCEVSNTAMTLCKVTIGDCYRVMWLPVMDHKNKAIVNPTTRDISDATMRCLVKCLAMFGLGHYIYAGEDLPQQTPIEEDLDVIQDWECKIGYCNSMEELAEVWMAMPKPIQPKLLKSKDAKKAQLEGKS